MGIEEIYGEVRDTILLQIANEYRRGLLTYSEFHEDMDSMGYLYP